ncbi:hypothetical protein ACHHYP_17348 [Achlya hypogyna]|uniref:Uncharacterized protein n=1 Tax=Achlya hypogyna TaxID=1202772 RepID=A0A1V9Y4N5_ACHHY|nr:hypothetical protein ACHHYP_17348 [Achlya hypogyna]
MSSSPDLPPSTLAWTFLCLCVFIAVRIYQQARSPSTWMQAFAAPMALCLPLHTTQHDAILDTCPVAPPDVGGDALDATTKPQLLHECIVSPVLQAIVWWEQATAVPIDVSDVVMSPLLAALALLLPRKPTTPPTRVA